MTTHLTVKNYHSIKDIDIELARINVFSSTTNSKSTGSLTLLIRDLLAIIDCWDSTLEEDQHYIDTIVNHSIGGETSIEYTSSEAILKIKNSKVECERSCNYKSFQGYPPKFYGNIDLRYIPLEQLQFANTLAEDYNSNPEKTFYIGTHTPYLFCALNNLIYAFDLSEKKEEKVEDIVPAVYHINLDDVKAYNLDGGVAVSLVDYQNRLLHYPAIDNILEDTFDVFNKLAYLQD